jgi:hypothetical protein
MGQVNSADLQIKSRTPSQVIILKSTSQEPRMHLSLSLTLSKYGGHCSVCSLSGTKFQKASVCGLVSMVLAWSMALMIVRRYVEILAANEEYAKGQCSQ